MATFHDQALLELADPARLAAVLAATTTAGQDRLRRMLAGSYELSSVRLEQITGVSVTAVTVQEPVWPATHVQGNISQSLPSQTRSDLYWREHGQLPPSWIDLLAQLDVTVVAEVDPGGVDSVLMQSLDTFSTLDDFRAQFSFIDLDAFMTEHDLTTVEDLRSAFHYLKAKIQMKIPPVFEPADPANQHSIGLLAAVLIVDPPDLTSVLRSVRLLERATRSGVPPRAAGLFGEVLSPYAPVVILSAASVQSAGLDAAAVQELLTQAGVASVLHTPA